MREFVYFIPGRISDTHSDWSVYGLAHLNGCPCPRSGCLVTGPDGLQGTVLRPRTDNRVRVSLTEQEWRREPQGRHYVGMWRDEVPGPSDLIIDVLPRKKTVKLQDGNEWDIPLINALPRVFDYGVDGKDIWTLGEVVGKYSNLSRLAKIAAPILYRKGATKADIEEAESVLIDFVVAVLQASYRVGCMEIAMLKILSENQFWEIILAAFDWDSYVDLRKKDHGHSASSGPSGESGACQSSQGESMDIVLPMES